MPRLSHRVDRLERDRAMNAPPDALRVVFRDEDACGNEEARRDRVINLEFDPRDDLQQQRLSDLHSIWRV